jgi:hypothetical protein
VTGAVTEAVGQERHDLRRGLQDGPVGVDVDPIQALDVQRDVPIGYVVDRRHMWFIMTASVMATESTMHLNGRECQVKGHARQSEANLTQARVRDLR